MEKFKNLKQVIKSLLEKDKALADNEKLLNWRVWEQYGGGTTNQITFDAYKMLPSESSIQRLRRMIENENPHLRGLYHRKRTTIMQDKVKNDLRQL